MFTTSKALLTFSLLVAIVNSTTGPVIQDFDPNSDDALSTNMFFDGISTDDDMTTSGALTDMFDSGLTVDANPVGDQQNLLTADASAGNSCSAEDRQSLSASGRLRRREGSSSKSGGGKTCVSPTDEGSEEPLDPFLLQLPMVDEVAAPIIESRRDVCPEWKFGDRDIALCSADEPQVITYQGTRTITIKNAKICMSSVGP